LGGGKVQALREGTEASRPARTGNVALQVRDLTMRFGDRLILDHVNLEVCEGGFVCVVGASGSGKTTLLRALAGLAHPAEGEACFQQKPIAGPSRDRAIIFQDYSKALLPWRTVSGNVALSLEARGVPPSERADIIDALLVKMGLAHAKNQFPSQLSGGMQQRVQIARCLAQNPKLLLMDEPFGALDAMTRQTLQDEILALTADNQVTTVFITHDLEEAIYLGDQVVVLGGSPASVVENIAVDLPRPRNQLFTREDTRFLSYRHRLFELLARDHGPVPLRLDGRS
jgi:ABC-type nitrate/sulfonate/bicarbonate transport system ATPase subunit